VERERRIEKENEDWISTSTSATYIFTVPTCKTKTWTKFKETGGLHSGRRSWVPTSNYYAQKLVHQMQNFSISYPDFLTTSCVVFAPHTCLVKAKIKHACLLSFLGQ
jgi:hypothetical protein